MAIVSIFSGTEIVKYCISLQREARRRPIPFFESSKRSFDNCLQSDCFSNISASFPYRTPAKNSNYYGRVTSYHATRNIFLPTGPSIFAMLGPSECPELFSGGGILI
mmetsp:Transcript_31647/g.66114  ORF Transcript_31647/g.66114 Transcript_31647/m.66114 type:complete len:107 (-) Transcript_31647:818-1138(-)